MAAAERYAAAGQTVDRCHALLFAVMFGGKEDAASLLRQVRALEDPSWPPRMRSLTAIAEAHARERAHDTRAALNAWREALKLERTEMGGASLTTLSGLSRTELELGLAQEATEHLSEAVETAQRIGHLIYRWASGLTALTAARLMLGDQAGARQAAEETFLHARRYGLRPEFVDHLALLAAREGRPRTAALLLGLAEAGYARFNGDRRPIEKRHADEAACLVRSALGETAFAALRREGRSAAIEDRIGQDALARHDVTWA